MKLFGQHDIINLSNDQIGGCIMKKDENINIEYKREFIVSISLHFYKIIRNYKHNYFVDLDGNILSNFHKMLFSKDDSKQGCISFFL